MAASFLILILIFKKPETLQQWSIDKVSHWNDIYQIIVLEKNMCLFCGHLWNTFNK